MFGLENQFLCQYKYFPHNLMFMNPDTGLGQSVNVDSDVAVIYSPENMWITRCPAEQTELKKRKKW